MHWAMRIVGQPALSTDDLAQELAAGGRFVFFEYCISLVIITLRRPSAIYYLRPGELGLVRGLPFCLISLALGWWGIPWGFIYTPLALINNLRGGCDVTEQVRTWLAENHVPAS
jgi:hypothetical protein